MQIWLSFNKHQCWFIGWLAESVPVVWAGVPKVFMGRPELYVLCIEAAFITILCLLERRRTLYYFGISYSPVFRIGILFFL